LDHFANSTFFCLTPKGFRDSLHQGKQPRHANENVSSQCFIHFGSPENTGSGADAHDYDRDGLVNLLEYALTGDPKSPDPWHQPLMPPSGGAQRAIAFRCDAGRTDVTYTVQASASQRETCECFLSRPDGAGSG
jgi:hypothetical protein